MAQMAAFTKVRAQIAALNGEDAKRQFITLAGRERDKVLAAGASSARAFVNGQADDSLNSATVPGLIRFEFSRIGNAAKDIWARIIATSPYSPKLPNAKPPTHYRDEHIILLNGDQVDALPDQLAPEDEVIFVNVQPYSRKIELGFSAQAPHGVYQAVAALMSQKYGATIKITYSWREIPSLTPSRRSNRRRSDPTLRFPSITISQH